MANPFGDCDDEEYERYQTKSRSSTLSSSKMNPFGSPQSLDSSSDRQSINSSNYVGTYTMGEGAVEKEGLFCPECFEEFRQISEMIDHMSKFHLTPSGTSKSTNQLKNIFTKIKTKVNQSPIIPAFDRSESLDERLIDPTFNPTEDWKLQMVHGPRRSHFQDFKKVREGRIERFVLETNKLLIRLDKLLRDYPFDGDNQQRRTYEQSIVSWIDDSLVPLCPTCTIKFGLLTRKKHHCRLCGAVMCSKCSKYLTFQDCYKLVGSVTGCKVDQRKQRLSITPSGGGNLLSKLAGSASPLIGSDLVSQLDTKLDSVRICFECEKLMIMRLEKVEKAEVVVPVVELYGKLREQVEQFDRQLPVFMEMAESINNGNSQHSQSDLQASKRSLTRTGETLDLLSKKIEISGLFSAKQKAEMDPAEVLRREPSLKQQNLQRNIRRATVLYLKRLQQAHSIAIQSSAQQ